MIRVDSLSKNFGDKWALSDTSWTLPANRSLGLLGPNGAGKSTTMKILTGMLRPSKGQIEINGVNILENPIYAKSQMGYLGESPSLHDEMNPCQYLHFVSGLKSIEKNQRNSQVDRALELLHLNDVAYQPIAKLSKGFRQRVGIAQALLGEPPLLILDEPSSGLDPQQVVEFRNILQKLKKNHAILLSSHALSEIEQICDEVVILNQGRIRAQGDLKQLLAQRKTQALVIVELAEKVEGLALKLEEIEGVGRVEEVEERLEIYFNHPVSEINFILPVLIEGGCSIRSVSQKQLNLEEVFIEVTQ